MVKRKPDTISFLMEENDKCYLTVSDDSLLFETRHIIDNEDGTKSYEIFADFRLANAIRLVRGIKHYKIAGIYGGKNGYFSVKSWEETKDE